MGDCCSLTRYFLCSGVVCLLCFCVPVPVLPLPFLDSQLPGCSLYLLHVCLVQLHTPFFSQLLEERWRAYCHFPSLWAFEQNIGASWAGWLLTLTMCSPGGAVKPNERDPAGWPVSQALPFRDYLFIYVLSPLPPHPISRSGYAVTAGHFSQPTTTDVVGGAPQDGGIGKVWLFVKQ